MGAAPGVANGTVIRSGDGPPAIQRCSIGRFGPLLQCLDQLLRLVRAGDIELGLLLVLTIALLVAANGVLVLAVSLFGVVPFLIAIQDGGPCALG